MDLRASPSTRSILSLAQDILPDRWLAMSEPSARRRRGEGESNGGPDLSQMEPAVGVVRVNGGAEESRMIHSVNGLRPRRVLMTV